MGLRASAIAASISVATLMGASAAGLPTVPGPQGDATGVTPQGWRVTPAGRQTALVGNPLAVAVSPDGRLVLVANGGYNQHDLTAVDPGTGRVLQTIDAGGGNSGGPWQLEEGHAHGYYVGLAFSPDGKSAYASDGPGSSLHTFSISGSISGHTVTELQRIKLTSNVGNQGAYPAGIAVSRDGSRLYVAGNLDNTLFVVDPARRLVVATVPVGSLPYGVALNRSGTLAFVTNWGSHTVSVVDLVRDTLVRTVNVGTHPSAIAGNPVRNEIYVANSDSDTVSVLDGATGLILRTLDLRPYPGAPVGAMPSALTVSRDGTTLYVANAGDDDVAVVRLASASSAGADAVAGLIPTAWFPSGVALDPTGTTLFVANMKGLGVGPGPAGIYWPTLMQGTLSTIQVPDAAALARYTAQVAANDRFNAHNASWPAGVIPAVPGGPTPIKHVIYVMKENRTYDQVLGDLGRGNGDPRLAIFGQRVTPNTHALAQRFVTFDNFYADAEVSADGWSWSNGAYANTYNQKNWPLDYGGYARPYDFGGFGDNGVAGQPGERPGGSYLWDELAAKGISYENFGFFVDIPVDLQSSIPGLIGHTDLQYPGWDLYTPDQTRIDEWLRVFAGYEGVGTMPTTQFVYLPSDHTFDTTPKARRPTAYVADNDLALGRLVEAVSHSRFWASTAIFVVEDDAQDGPDHVEGHRTVALAISPYTQTGIVDSTFYSTVSMLRTMELILGVGPMSQFDAAATPMSTAFTSTPNLRPYTALMPQVSLVATNGPNAPLAGVSAGMDFSRPDAQPAMLANEAVWKSVRGANSPMPTSGGSPWAEVVGPTRWAL
jgi:YVTN family beta-propeller protein